MAQVPEEGRVDDIVDIKTHMAFKNPTDRASNDTEGTVKSKED